jgi:hypothetical protein
MTIWRQIKCTNNLPVSDNDTSLLLYTTKVIYMLLFGIKTESNLSFTKAKVFPNF